MIVPTRIVHHNSGELEIVRTLPASGLDLSERDALAAEISLLWLLPREALDYVRVGMIRGVKSRGGPLMLRGQGAMVAGYSRLADDTPADPKTGGFTRRLFYLIKDDDARNMIDVPQGAVDPMTLLPGFPGAAPNVARLAAAYPKHVRKMRRSILRDPVAIDRILAEHFRLSLAES